MFDDFSLSCLRSGYCNFNVLFSKEFRLRMVGKTAARGLRESALFSETARGEQYRAAVLEV